MWNTRSTTVGGAIRVASTGDGGDGLTRLGTGEVGGVDASFFVTFRLFFLPTMRDLIRDFRGRVPAFLSAVALGEDGILELGGLSGVNNRDTGTGSSSEPVSDK